MFRSILCLESLPNLSVTVLNTELVQMNRTLPSLKIDSSGSTIRALLQRPTTKARLALRKQLFMSSSLPSQIAHVRASQKTTSMRRNEIIITTSFLVLWALSIQFYAEMMNNLLQSVLYFIVYLSASQLHIDLLVLDFLCCFHFSCLHDCRILPIFLSKLYFFVSDNIGTISSAISLLRQMRPLLSPGILLSFPMPVIWPK